MPPPPPPRRRRRRYGERYTNSTGFGPSPPLLFPKIVVYTSPDLASWTYHGPAIADWPTKPYGTFFTPWAVFNEVTQLYVLWFNAYLSGCCDGGWGVATSSDGLNFTVVSLNETGAYPQVDCNGLFVDDDGTGYLLYSSEGGWLAGQPSRHHHEPASLSPHPLSHPHHRPQPRATASPSRC